MENYQVSSGHNSPKRGGGNTGNAGNIGAGNTRDKGLETSQNDETDNESVMENPPTTDEASSDSTRATTGKVDAANELNAIAGREINGGRDSEAVALEVLKEAEQAEEEESKQDVIRAMEMEAKEHAEAELKERTIKKLTIVKNAVEVNDKTRAQIDRLINLRARNLEIRITTWEISRLTISLRGTGFDNTEANMMIGRVKEIYKAQDDLLLSLDAELRIKEQRMADDEIDLERRDGDHDIRMATYGTRIGISLSRTLLSRKRNEISKDRLKDIEKLLTQDTFIPTPAPQSFWRRLLG